MCFEGPHKGFWFSKGRDWQELHRKNSLITMILLRGGSDRGVGKLTVLSFLVSSHSLTPLPCSFYQALVRSLFTPATPPSPFHSVSRLNEFRFKLSVADLIEFSVWPPTRESISTECSGVLLRRTCTKGSIENGFFNFWLSF